MNRKLRRANKRDSEATAEVVARHVSSEDVARVEKSQQQAAETSKEVVKDIGKELQVHSPKQLRDYLGEATQDGAVSIEELRTLFSGLIGLHEVDQKLVHEEVGFLAGKAKEARINGEEALVNLEEAGLIDQGSFLENLKRGSIFMPNGRRIDAHSILGAYTIMRSARAVPRRPSDDALKDRLYSDVPPIQVMHSVGPVHFQMFDYTSGGEIPVDATLSVATTKYDPKVATHIKACFFIKEAAADTARAVASAPSIAGVPMSFVGLSELGTANDKRTSFEARIVPILELWPSLKPGDYFPLSSGGPSSSTYWDAATGMVVMPGYGQIPELMRLDEINLSIDSGALIRIAALIGVSTYNHPLAAVTPLLQGSLESLLKQAGTMDWNTQSD